MPAAVPGYGRQIRVFFANGVRILLAAGIAATTGFTVHLVTDSWPATVATATLVLTLLAAGTVPAVAWAFGRFDVAGDVPA